MKKNVGTIDAVIRFVAAVLIGVLIYLKVVTGTLAIVLGIAAVAFVITGLLGRCMLYSLIGFRTCPRE
jgi:hypothetical protein